MVTNTEVDYSIPSIPLTPYLITYSKAGQINSFLDYATKMTSTKLAVHIISGSTLVVFASGSIRPLSWGVMNLTSRLRLKAFPN